LPRYRGPAATGATRGRRRAPAEHTQLAMMTAHRIWPCAHHGAPPGFDAPQRGGGGGGGGGRGDGGRPLHGSRMAWTSGLCFLSAGTCDTHTQGTSDRPGSAPWREGTNVIHDGSSDAASRLVSAGWGARHCMRGGVLLDKVGQPSSSMHPHSSISPALMFDVKLFAGGGFGAYITAVSRFGQPIMTRIRPWLGVHHACSSAPRASLVVFVLGLSVLCGRWLPTRTRTRHAHTQAQHTLARLARNFRQRQDSVGPRALARNIKQLLPSYPPPRLAGCKAR
jgi:hypothetical protein